MDSFVKVNCFIIFVLCSFVGCEAKNWLCPAKSRNKSAHKYNCRSWNNNNCHLISNDFNLPLNNSEVTKLKLNHCSFNVIASCLKSYENVISLDISDSNYTSLESLDLNHTILENLNASHNIIDRIPRKFFANLPKIIEVDFSYNSIEKIDSKTFKGADKLTTIHLSYNAISSISSESFANLKYLKYVDLIHNYFEYYDVIFTNNTSVHISWKNLTKINTFGMGKKLRIIANSSTEGLLRTTTSEYSELHCNERSFERMRNFLIAPNQIENVRNLFECFGSPATSSKIRRLKLSGNFIGNVSSLRLQRFSELKHVILSDTQLESFDIQELEHKTHLTKINLSKNRLKTLENPQILNTFRSLKYFNIANNEICNIQEIISNLSSSVAELNLSGNIIGDIGRISFEKFENLRVLRLNNTSLQFSDENPFEQNTKLIDLDISNNNLAGWNFSTMAKTLRKLEKFTASKCQIEDTVELIKLFGPRLSKIDLSNNYCPQLKLSMFQNRNLYTVNLANMSMVELEMDRRVAHSLNISFNRLSKLKFTIPMPNMELLDISGNDLTDNALIDFEPSKVPKLAKLNIKNNKFSCKYLVHLVERIKIKFPYEVNQLGDPYKQKHDRNCHPNVTKHWLHLMQSNAMFHEFFCEKTFDGIDDDLDDNSFQLITDDFKLNSNNSVVTEVKFRRCDFKVIALCLKFYENVISLDISNSEYRSLLMNDSNEPLQLFDLNSNFLKITKLNASHNIIDRIPRKFFANFPDIVELDLSYNKFENIDSSTLEHANKLKKIHLSYNKIRHISSESFAHLKDLEFISLSNNHILMEFLGYKRNRDIFYNNSKLVELHLESNLIRIHQIPIIKSYAKFVYLSFVWNKYNNKIETEKLGERVRIIPNSPTEGIRISSDYTELRCNENSFKNVLRFLAAPQQIENVHDLFECFRSSPKLQQLNLSGNFVGKMNSTMLQRFIELKSLVLRDTQLESFDFAILQHLPNMMQIDISKNGLKNFENLQLLREFKSLYSFSIADNEVENIPEIVNSLSSSVRFLNLGGNFVGNISRINFAKFKNLTGIWLQNTSLKFDDVNPFEQNTKLKWLDISNNNLKNVTLLNFDKLHLPTLNSLNIEDNIFSCQYLVKLLEQITIEWPNLELFGDPYKQRHGKDCHPRV